ncbi:hypothetical protein BDN72DRAFT_777661 [Pluteus cervinus]|uniref:Uncharacterized protein n=1 Tax=Pluteus cervinus TaxID=181527 RepID=A0ACD3A8L2_9AGAR|nr:hypothetical protein BDN72DRAFT_777661 [Pluteus cervinus]
MLTVLALTLAFLRVQAAPFSEAGPATDPTLAHTVLFGIQPRSAGAEANMRTLYDIVRSCVFTIAACVYRAVHQNIPNPQATMWERLRVRMKITIYALIAPDAVIWWAMRQRYGAIMVAKQVNELKYAGLNWTQTHGQFAQMGGFARKDNKCVLHPPTLIELIKEGRIDLDQLQLTKGDIDDKSKGDILSKALVAFQTTWFVFECLARLQQDLPLIELEVVTLAFAVLNVITYALWWYKPLNILRPIYLHIRETPADWSPGQIVYVEGDGWWISAWKRFIKQPFLAVAKSILRLFGVATQTKSQEDETGVGIVARARAVVGKVVKDIIKEDVGKRRWWITVWERLMKQLFLVLVEPLLELFDDQVVRDDATHVSIFYGMKVSKETWRLVLWLSCFIAMIFGAIHFLSWHSPFPTRTELLLWRISSIILVAQPALILLFNLFAQIYERAPSGSRKASIAGFCRTFFQILSVFVGPIPYIIARYCLFILVLLTLNHLPPRALDSIAWTFYIPHL